MKIASLGFVSLGIVSLAALAGCQSEEQNRKIQVRDHLVNQCNMQVQMAAQSGLPNMAQLCTCIGTTIDNMPAEQFKQMTTNPMQASQFGQTISAQCMQSLGPSMMGGGMSGGGMQPGMQPNMGPGIYGGAAQGANASAGANASQ